MASLIYGSTNIGTVLQCDKAYSSQKISNIALDGTPYIQQTGTAVERRAVSTYCPTKEKRDKLDKASNEGALLQVTGWKGLTIKGFIEKDVRWDEFRDEHGVGRFTLVVKEEVVDE